MTPYEALYGRRYRISIHWHEDGEMKYLEPELVDQATKAIQKIQQRMKTSQCQQKSYTDRRHRSLEFEVGDQVFVRTSIMGGVMRFGKKGKLSPRFVRPFKILERVRKVAYQLVRPPSITGIHEVFHVSILRKYVNDPSHILKYQEVEIT